MRHHAGAQLAADCTTPLDFRQLFKLRLVVAALGETQWLGWWNSGVLTGRGDYLFLQGFPRSSPFVQTRTGFRVAQLACDEALVTQHTPGGPITCHLFRLMPQLEDAFENQRNRWMDQPEPWVDPFQSAWSLTSEQGPQPLIELAGLEPTAIDWAPRQMPLTAKAMGPCAGLLRQGHLPRCRKNSESLNQLHAADPRLGAPKTVDILERMLSRGFDYKPSVFDKGKEVLASIGILLTYGGQPSMMDPRQK